MAVCSKGEDAVSDGLEGALVDEAGQYLEVGSAEVHERVAVADTPAAGRPADLGARRCVAKMPQSLDFTETAGLPLAGLTALQALRDELAVKGG
ncbi:hypothetical protein ACFV20_01350 [Streptomyces sp. NPDC059696]|uniref:hypothetical protein n=1 Tax=Streptomyces sp. NPDC059696 TaxID=3346911 RepID=UPI00368AFA1C